MSKKQVHNISLDHDTFKLVKKNKQRVVLQLNDDKIQKINVKDKVFFIDEVSNKKCKKEVKRLHHYPDYKDADQNINKKYLGYKKKDVVDYKDIENKFSKDDIKKFGVLGIEVKIEKHIFRKILLSLIILVAVVVSLHYIDNFIMKINDNKITSSIGKIEDEKTNYVFIDINPSFVLTMKADKVTDVACLNNDCVSIYEDIEVVGKNIDDSIASLYNLAQKKGFDTSNGVSVKATGNVSIDKKDYITIEYISETTKDELLTNLKNNDSIKDNSNDDYYTKLWAELKKDQDYGKVYECSMNKDELECYIKNEMFLGYMADNPTDLLKEINSREKIARVLNKFGIKNESEDTLIGITVDLASIYIGDNKFTCYEGEQWCTIDALDGSSIEVSLVKNPNVLNLLNPNAVLNNVAFTNRSYNFAETNIYSEHIKICDINGKNCTRETYRTCDFDEETYRLFDCKDIDAKTYNELTPSDNTNENVSTSNPNANKCDNGLHWSDITNSCMTEEELIKLIEDMISD